VSEPDPELIRRYAEERRKAAAEKHAFNLQTFLRPQDEDECVGRKLNFIRAEELSYATPNYQPAFIRQLADGLNASDLGGALAAAALNALADCPEALAALNHAQPTVPADVLGLNRAVHYNVHLKILGGKALAEQTLVGELWGVGSAQIKADNSDHGGRARTIIERIIAEARKHPAYESEGAALAALHADMKDRAKRMHKPTRKPRRKARR
jgi:hypothetical protein